MHASTQNCIVSKLKLLRILIFLRFFYSWKHLEPMKPRNEHLYQKCSTSVTLAQRHHLFFRWISIPFVSSSRMCFTPDFISRVYRSYSILLGWRKPGPEDKSALYMFTLCVPVKTKKKPHTELPAEKGKSSRFKWNHPGLLSGWYCGRAFGGRRSVGRTEAAFKGLDNVKLTTCDCFRSARSHFAGHKVKCSPDVTWPRSYFVKSTSP